MNSIQSILVVCLLAFAASDARILSRRQDNDTQPLCGECMPLSDIELQGLTAAVKDLGTALQAVTTTLGDAVKKALAKLDDLKVGLRDTIKSIRDTIGPVLDKVYDVVKNIEKCPALKALFLNLKTNLIAVLTILYDNWDPIINAPDLTSALDEVSKVLLLALPHLVKLLRDLLYNIVQLVPGLCDILGQTVWTLFAPKKGGAVYDLLESALKLLGETDGGLSLLTGLLGALGDVLGLAVESPGKMGNPVKLVKALCDFLAILQITGLMFCNFG